MTKTTNNEKKTVINKTTKNKQHDKDKKKLKKAINNRQFKKDKRNDEL